MAFEIQIVSNTPLTPVGDLDEVAVAFLNQIGYFPKAFDPKSDIREVRNSIPYRLFRDCFLERIDKAWYVEELATVLKTSKPTVYRHINKLKSLDLLEEVSVENADGESKKAYRIRYSNLAKAWNFTEEHVKLAVENYRKTVDHIQSLVTKKEKR